jgi:2-polyprenyl-6-methoxyphenol hydroxylase-like FAD-dependent oxidoreductase
MSAFDVCVRGSGAVAMAAALALSRLGLSVAWTGHHRAPVRRPRRAHLCAECRVDPLLTTLKVWDSLPADARTPVHDMRIEGDAGSGAALFGLVGGVPSS